MRSAPRRSRAALVVLWSLGAALLAPLPLFAHALSAAQVREWNAIGQAQLTPDGQFLVYVLQPITGDRHATIVVRGTTTDTESRYDAGVGRSPARFRLSASSRWLGFRVLDEAGKSSVHLVQLATGELSTFDRADDFAFAPVAEWLAVLGGATADRTRDLSLRDLTNKTSVLWRDVDEFAFSPDGRALAWSDAGALHVRDLRARTERTLDSASEARYRNLTWSARGHALAALRYRSEDHTNTLVAVTRLGEHAESKTIRAPQAWADFPQGYEISTDPVIVSPTERREPLMWRADERGVFFGVRLLKPPRTLPAENPRVIVWHWDAAQLPRELAEGSGAAQRRLQAGRDRWFGGRDPESLFSYLSFVSLPDGHFRALADATLRNVSAAAEGAFVLGYDTRAYDRTRNVSGEDFRDYSLIALASGHRIPFARHVRVSPFDRIAPPPVLAPNGRFVLYLENEALVAYDTARGTRKTIAGQASLPLPQGWRSYRDDRDFFPTLQGWTRGCRDVLIWDRFDLWAVPLDGTPARNLTVNGQRLQRRYVRTDFSETDEKSASFQYAESGCSVDLRAPMYFRTIDLATRRAGLAVLRDGASEPELLHAEDAALRYLKAADADVYVARRETAVESPSFSAIDASWAPTRRLTDINPQQRGIAWSPGVRLLSYRVPDGEVLNAVLHLPASYETGRSYPLLVTVYEQQSDRVHEYRPPSLSGGVTLSNDIPRWTQEGYAVLEPDIHPREGQSGQSAVDAVTAAVQAAIESGIAQPHAIGLEGHSYGGFEASFLAARTKLFAAVVAKSGPTNWVSYYGAGTRPDRRPNSGVAEGYRRPYVTGPWWEQWQTYVDNSPLFHVRELRTPLLLVHGDEDGSVAFSQSVELFNALRRLGDRPVVLLQYAGIGHELGGDETRADISARQLQFFDHFLKGAAAPAWWVAAAAD